LQGTSEAFGFVLLRAVDIFLPLIQNDRAVVDRSQFLQERIQSIKREIVALGDLRPGALSLQYNVCGSASCRCKADPPLKHGPYPQVSFTWHGKSTTQFVREDDVDEVRQQLENYRRLRDLVDEWIGHALELSRLRSRERRVAVGMQKNARKIAKSQQTRKRHPGK
jgi:hypothetical protein